MIESVRVEDEEQITNRLHPGSSLAVTIPHGKEHLEIRYTSLNLSAPERARFRYRLEGYETAWTEAGSRRVAPFSELTPGSYRFQVIACNEDGVWNETGSTLAIVVQPAFWQTASFRVFSAAALLALIVGVVYFLSTQRLQHELAAMKQKEALEQERSRIARDLHDQLGANLTQVALLGEMAESDKDLPAEVEDHARQISQTARETSRALDEIVWAVNPSNDTLEGLVNYACKYAQDYLEIADIRYRLEVPPKVPDASIAPEVRHNVFLAFKESVNNVVKHSQAKSARIRLILDARTFTIEIEDDGRGVAAADEKKGRNGLRNMRRRMEDVGGVFSLGPASGKGTLVRLTAPLKTE
jgi:signal transduction histidine kinase